MGEIEGGRRPIRAADGVPGREYDTDQGRRVAVVGKTDGGFVRILSRAYNHEVDVPPEFDLFEIEAAVAPASPRAAPAQVRYGPRRSGSVSYPEGIDVGTTDGLVAAILHTLSVGGALDAEEIHQRVSSAFPGVRALDSRIRSLLAVSLLRSGAVLRMAGRYTLPSQSR